jgi:beta-lactamase class C
MRSSHRRSAEIKKLAILLIACGLLTRATLPANASASPPRDSIRAIVDATIPALMTRDGIPGMAVAVTVNGKAYEFDYGAAALHPRVPVTAGTLFEIGSVSKTFTATLASLADVRGNLSLSDRTARYLPELDGTPFGNVKLLSLGTHTPGGLPLQFPDDVATQDDAIAYFKRWHPTYAEGTYRTYANPGIAMLGLIAAKSMGGDFRSLMQQQLFPSLGLTHTFIQIPESERANYAWGYEDGDQPIRMKGGALSDEAYGVRTNASDMIRFIQENIDGSDLSPMVAQALVQTHTGYFQAGPMTQDLIWEQYPYPVTLASLQEGNSAKTIFDPQPVKAIAPPEPPKRDVWINKTGSTNGFATYVAFVPSRRVGIVLLANRDYPIPDRVSAAYAILEAIVRAY